MAGFVESLYNKSICKKQERRRMNWKNVQIVPTFVDQGVSCYQLEGGDFKNEYYIVSEAETRKLLNNPEIVGYETYYCLIPSTSQMLYYFKEQKKVTTANILSIVSITVCMTSVFCPVSVCSMKMRLPVLRLNTAS